MRCLLCGSDQKNTFSHVKSFGFPLVYYQCENCGLIFQSAEESQAADPEFYGEAYRRIYQSSDTPNYKDIWIQEQRAEHLIELIREINSTPPRRILDIGASTGILLKKFNEAFGSDVFGVEPGDAYCQYAKEQGIRMFSSVESLIESSPENFDLVSMIHVLEHLSDPVVFLKNIKENLLAKDGLLLVEVPNLYAHDSYELAHLACYSPQTLIEAINYAGFEEILLKKHGVPRSEMLNLYLTVVAGPLPENDTIPTIEKENFVGFKRKISMFYRKMIQKLFPHSSWLPLPDERQG